MTVSSSFSTIPPIVTKKWLFVISGIVWTMVGIILIRLALTWLVPLDSNKAIFYGILGIILALITRIMFVIFSNKNVKRLYELPEKISIFAFQEIKSYVLVVFMIALGITLRHSIFPKELLAIGYIGIGGGLSLASYNYYKEVPKIES